MEIGLLNTFIFITKNEVIVDAIGNHKNAWVPYYNCHATVISNMFIRTEQVHLQAADIQE